jgi:hypothetical protein
MTTIAERLRRLKIMDEVGSDNPLGREAADALDAAEKALDEITLVIGLTAIKYESHRDILQKSYDKARAALSKLRRTK